MFLLLLSLFLFQCKEKYETAQVLLQGLEEDAHTEDDRRLLQKCILWLFFYVFDDVNELFGRGRGCPRVKGCPDQPACDKPFAELDQKKKQIM